MVERLYAAQVFFRLLNSKAFGYLVVVNRYKHWLDQIFADVKYLIEELPDLQKEVLKMRYYQGLSFKEIAELTGVSINTALGRMRYAILNLRRIAHDKDIILTI